MKIEEIFTYRLRSALDASGYTRRSFGESIGVTESTVQKWLRGENSPPLGKIELIASKLDTTPTWLMGGNIGHKELRDSMILRGISYLQKIEDTGDIEGILEMMESLIDRQAEDKLKKNQKKKPV